MSHEGSKSLRRRWIEDFTGVIPWRTYLSGRILDVGAGDDPLPLPNVTSFDRESGDVRGDGNHLYQYFKENSFDCCHLSQCLEHLMNPAATIQQCLNIINPGGYVAISVPDMITFEGGRWPSPFNGDHKHTFSMIYKGSLAPSHIYIPEFLLQFQGEAEVILARYVERNYDWFVGVSRDQTWLEADGVECWNEIVLRKPVTFCGQKVGQLIGEKE